jgi:HPt (histidine-containing phosphotransfer) domain-containing protein
MELLWKAVCARTADADDLARLERCAHSLAGSGAVFGHDSLSARARGLERELHRIVERGSPGEGEAANVGAAIAALRRCL